MSKKSRTTFKKRQKEMARQQRRREKVTRRQERKEEKSTIIPSIPEGEDPHIAGIQPGPQPLPDEWNYVPGRPSRDRPPEGEP